MIILLNDAKGEVVVKSGFDFSQYIRHDDIEPSKAIICMRVQDTYPCLPLHTS